MAGMLDVVNNYVPSYQQNLDQVAQSLMGSVNYLMSTGYDQAGNQGVPFFLGTGASDIEVNPTLVANPADIGRQRFAPSCRVVGHERGRHRSRRGWRAAELSNGDDVGPRGRLVPGRVGGGVDGCDDDHRRRGRRGLQPTGDRDRAGYCVGEQPIDRPADNYDKRQFSSAIVDWCEHGPGADEHGHVPERLRSFGKVHKHSGRNLAVPDFHGQRVIIHV